MSLESVEIQRYTLAIVSASQIRLRYVTNVSTLSVLNDDVLTNHGSPILTIADWSVRKNESVQHITVMDMDKLLCVFQHCP